MAMVAPNILGLNLNKVPIIKPLGALVLGICTGYYFDLYPLYIFVGLVFALTILQAVCFYYRRNRYCRILFPILFYMFWLVLGIWSVNRSSPNHQKLHFSDYEAESYLIVINEEPINKGGYLRFSANVKSVVHNGQAQRCTGKLMVTIALDTLAKREFAYGDLLHIYNLVQIVKPPKNPYEFDYKAYLRSKNTLHQCFLSLNQVVKLDVKQGNVLIDKALCYRKEMLGKFSESIKNQKSLQLAMALIFGYRSEIDEETVNVFRNTGTVHILSVSGLHVGLVFTFLMFMLKWMNRLSYGRHLKLVLITVAIWFYVVLTGMSPPILRAGIMISFFIVSLAMNRKQVSLNTLFASALFILVYSPKSLFDVGFQLSYSAVLGILLLYPLLVKLYKPNNRWYSIAVEYIYISIAAQVFTLPLIFYYFGQFPTYFIPANLLLAIPSMGIMYLGVLLAVSPFSSLNYYVGWLLHGLLDLSVKGLAFLERLPASVLEGLYWDEIQVLIAFVVLFTMIWAWNYKIKKVAFLSLSLLISISAISNVNYVERRNYRGLRIYSVQSAIAIAHIKKGKIVLYSSFDSLKHKNHLFSVIPDLKRYGKESEVEFIGIPRYIKQNYMISVADKKILVLETVLQDSLKNVDVILWRKNTRNRLEDIRNLVGSSSIVIVDGSNSEKTVESLKQDEHMYILKNNFAYVWDEE